MKVSSLFKSKKEKEALSYLSKYVTPDAFEKISKGKLPDLELFKEGLVTFVITQVNDVSLNKLQSLQRDVVATIMASGGIVDCIISSIVIGTFGFPFEDQNDPRELCENTVKNLLELCKHDIKVIHGQEKGFFGNLGGPHRFSYGPIISNLSGKFSLLNKLEYGKMLKV